MRKYNVTYNNFNYRTVEYYIVVSIGIFPTSRNCPSMMLQDLMVASALAVYSTLPVESTDIVVIAPSCPLKIYKIIKLKLYNDPHCP